jgi:translation initiation factor 4G
MAGQPNSLPQAQHLRRESSQSAHSDMSNANMNRGFPPNAGRGRGFPPQHYQPNMANQSPQPYRSIPHQHMGRGMAPAFQPQGPMQQNSPYRQNRSPAITPATMHQQAHLANPQGMPYYQGQPYQQPVRIPSTMSNLSLACESSKSHQPSIASRFSQQFFTSFFSHSVNTKELDFRAPSDQPNAFLQIFTPPFSSSTSDYEQYLTTLSNQNMYGMGQPGLDPYNGYYGQAYGLQQSIHYPGVPASPGRTHGFPQQMQAPYGVPGPYGQPPQAQGMSRTPSNMSERPPSAVPQPSTPAMTNVNHISHTHTPSVTAASPAPSSTFERPKKQSKAIVIKNGTHNFLTYSVFQF